MVTMDYDKIARRMEKFKTIGYLSYVNVTAGIFVKAISGTISITGENAPACVGVVGSWHGSTVSVNWDNGDIGTYILSRNEIYKGTIEGEPLQSMNTSDNQPTLVSNMASPIVLGMDMNPPRDIMTENMVGKRVKLLIHPSEGAWLNGLEKGGTYLVNSQNGNSFMIKENGLWTNKKYFGFTTGGSISTKPINDENFVNFENAIKSNKNNERDNNTDRYKVPRPLTKVGRKQEAGRGAISGARSKTRLGETYLGH